MPQSAVASMPPQQRAPLSDDQTNSLWTQLDERLSALRDRAAQITINLDEMTGDESHYERELAQNNLRSLVDTMREHEGALARLHDGTYGLCGVCGRAIPFERLEAIPEVDRCVGCVRIG